MFIENTQGNETFKISGSLEKYILPGINLKILENKFLLNDTLVLITERQQSKNSMEANIFLSTSIIPIKLD